MVQIQLFLNFKKVVILLSIKSLLVPFLIASFLLLNSCGRAGYGLIVNEGQNADERMEQIIVAVKNKDKESLKGLFSEEAIEEANIDIEMDLLFDFIKGDIERWERDSFASDESIRNGKKSLMIRSNYIVVTDEETYEFYVIDFYTDTINPDNEGIYMLEIITSEYDGEFDAWQERMRAGFRIPEVGLA